MNEATIDLFKENMKFSAGHFTIFSATERESLHGHNYQVHVSLTTQVDDAGLSFDYRTYKKKIYDLCQALNTTFLLPENSPYLKISAEGDTVTAHFNDERIPFLKKDVTLLPLPNITVETLSQWFLSQLLSDKNELAKHRITKLTVKVYSGPGQSGAAHWEK